VIKINIIYGSSKGANLITDKNNIGVAFSAAAAVTNPNWINRSGYTISSTVTTNDSATNTGSGTSVFWEAYDEETLSTTSSNDILFQLNGTTFYTATGYAQSTLDGYYPVTQNYFGDTMPIAFVASRTSSTYTFKLTNGSSQWQNKNGVDTMIGVNDTNDPAFEQAKWMIRTGQRPLNNKVVEIWRENSGNREYEANVTLNDDDEFQIVFNS